MQSYFHERNHLQWIVLHSWERGPRVEFSCGRNVHRGWFDLCGWLWFWFTHWDIFYFYYVFKTKIINDPLLSLEVIENCFFYLEGFNVRKLWVFWYGLAVGLRLGFLVCLLLPLSCRNLSGLGPLWTTLHPLACHLFIFGIDLEFFHSFCLLPLLLSRRSDPS